MVDTLLREYDYREIDKDNFIAEWKYLMTFLTKSQQEVIFLMDHFKVQMEKIIKFKYIFSRAYSDSVEKRVLSKWFDLVSLILVKVRKIFLSDSYSVDFFSDLLEEITNIENLDRAKEIILKNRCQNWLYLLSLERLKIHIFFLINYLVQDQNEETSI